MFYVVSFYTGQMMPDMLEYSDYTEAVKYFDKMVLCYPNNSYAIFKIGHMDAQMYHYGEATTLKRISK